MKLRVIVCGFVSQIMSGREVLLAMPFDLMTWSCRPAVGSCLRGPNQCDSFCHVEDTACRCLHDRMIHLSLIEQRRSFQMNTISFKVEIMPKANKQAIKVCDQEPTENGYTNEIQVRMLKITLFIKKLGIVE